MIALKEYIYVYIYTNICTVVAAQTGSMPTVNMTCAQAPIWPCMGPIVDYGLPQVQNI